MLSKIIDKIRKSNKKESFESHLLDKINQINNQRNLKYAKQNI